MKRSAAREKYRFGSNFSWCRYVFAGHAGVPKDDRYQYKNQMYNSQKHAAFHSDRRQDNLTK